MLYEPPKTKRYILIGAAAIVLAVLIVVAAPLLFKYKTLQTTPVANLSPKEKLQQEQIQKEFDKLEAMRKNTDVKQSSQEDIQKEFDALEKQRAQSNATPPTSEQIQAEFDKLEQTKR